MKKQFPELTRKEKDILLNIVKADVISRSLLQKQTDLKSSNFYEVIDSLSRYNLVVKDNPEKKKAKGRPSENLSLNNNFLNIFHIQLSKSWFLMAICDFTGNILEKAELPFSMDLTAGDFFNECIKYYENKKNIYDISYVTFISGFESRRPRATDFNETFYDFDFEIELENTLEIPVISDSIARAAALGIYRERFLNKSDSLLFCNLSAGIGLGLVHPNISEQFGLVERMGIEHWSLNYDGELCKCGQRGCIINTLGERSIISNVKKAIDNGEKSSLIPPFSINDVIEASNHDDFLAKDVMKHAADLFSITLKNLYRIFHFKVVSVGGSVSKNNTFFMDTLTNNLKNEPFELDFEQNFTLMASNGISYRLLINLLS